MLVTSWKHSKGLEADTIVIIEKPVRRSGSWCLASVATYWVIIDFPAPGDLQTALGYRASTRKARTEASSLGRGVKPARIRAGTVVGVLWMAGDRVGTLECRAFAPPSTETSALSGRNLGGGDEGISLGWPRSKAHGRCCTAAVES